MAKSDTRRGANVTTGIVGRHASESCAIWPMVLIMLTASQDRQFSHHSSEPIYVGPKAQNIVSPISDETDSEIEFLQSIR